MAPKKTTTAKRKAEAQASRESETDKDKEEQEQQTAPPSSSSAAAAATTTASAAAKEKAQASSPLEEHFSRLNAVIDRCGAKGYILEQGIPSRDEDEEEEEEEGEGKGKKQREYTAEEVSQLRVILVTDRREKCLNKYNKMVLGDQFGDSCLMFNTSFSYDIFDLIETELPKIVKKKSIGERFDHLLALTRSLNAYDTWLHDNEDPDTAAELLKKIGHAWKALLARSDAELEIDAEFTRPGVQCLLEKFEETASQCYNSPGVPWK